MRILPCLLVLAACPPPSGTPPIGEATDDTDAAEPSFSELDAGVWNFVDVDGMICGNGSATGVGINPGVDPTRVVFVVQGGGACWDGATCYVLKSATHVENSWGDAQLQSETRPLDSSPVFDRSDAANPWSTATWVFVPYCTGDLHAGRSEKAYDPTNPNRILHHHGDANMEAAVELVTEAMPDVGRVWALGFSAGGYGVQYQADRFVDAWPGADVALLADGSPMVHPYGGRWGTWRAAWDPRLPEDCEDCLTSAPAVLEARAAAALDARFGLLTSRNDEVITLYAGYPAGGLAGAVDRLVDATYADDDQLQAYVIDGKEHVLSGNLNRVGPDGVRLLDWFEAWRDDTEDWVDRY